MKESMVINVAKSFEQLEHSTLEEKSRMKKKS